MDTGKRKLVIGQLDRRFAGLKTLTDISVPPEGWIRTIRTVLKMSLRQLGMRLGISPQSAKEIEQREVDGSLTLKALREAANALEMKVVYVVIPKDESIEKLIERKANELAREIVMRTSNTMLLEDQGNSDTRIKKAIEEKTEEIKNKMPKYLWD